MITDFSPNSAMTVKSYDANPCLLIFRSALCPIISAFPNPQSEIPKVLSAHCLVHSLGGHRRWSELALLGVGNPP